MPNANIIGARIKNLREDNNISRESFCETVGISLSALSMYETGQRIPRDEIKLKIARQLNTSIEALFFTSWVHEMQTAHRNNKTA